MLSPSEAGPLVHYAVRIGNGTCRVNGTVVLDLMGLDGGGLTAQMRREGFPLDICNKSRNSRRSAWLVASRTLDTFATDSVALGIVFMPA